MKRLVLGVLFFIGGIFFVTQVLQRKENAPIEESKNLFERVLTSVSPSPLPSLPPLPQQAVIPQRLHVYQTFNNCGPASLSMLLSYLDVNASQQELGQRLRPYQNAQGDNDDKSVTLEELAIVGEEYGFAAYHRPNGNQEILQRGIASGLPVVIRTWLEPGEDIGHYRLVRGYEQNGEIFVQDDSLQGKDLRYTWSELDELWRAFNYEYLILAPEEKVAEVEAILGEAVSEEIAWKQAKTRILEELRMRPNDLSALFNLSVTEYELGNYEESIRYFEQVESRLPPRMLWYQIEPILAYYEAKQYDRVLAITDRILANNNRAFSELHYVRGQIFLERGQQEEALQSFRFARQYNLQFLPAQVALQQLE
jgi:tetratricopeptide (TPR) repeat protein